MCLRGGGGLSTVAHLHLNSDLGPVITYGEGVGGYNIGTFCAPPSVWLSPQACMLMLL